MIRKIAKAWPLATLMSIISELLTSTLLIGRALCQSPVSLEVFASFHRVLFLSTSRSQSYLVFGQQKSIFPN
jgi:hypothetical protein